jgi:hypothetical protein
VKKTRVLAGVAIATLAAAGVAAVLRSRLGHKPHPDDHASLEELEARLSEAEEPDQDASPTHIRRIIEVLQRNQGITAARLRRWAAGIRQGSLSPEQAAIAESDFDALEREADQRGV